MMTALVYVARCIILILATWFICNFIGKKSLAQFTPYDIAILFIISNVVSQPLVNKDTVKTALGIIVLALSVLFISRLSLFEWFYSMDAVPSILINRGKLDKAVLKKNHMNLYTLMSMLRIQGYYKMSDVYYVILEPSGELSVLPKVSARPATTEELALTIPQDGLSYPVILDGKLEMKMLQQAGISEKWLLETLKVQYHVKPHEVFYAAIDSEKKLYVSINA
ncbi:MAG: DUF421 domain-containing protein [Cellulosilyticaceae bacterium]